MIGDRHNLPAAEVEFVEGERTIWVHGPQGATTLRIKCTGTITVDQCQSLVPHGDVMVEGDIAICVPVQR